MDGFLASIFSAIIDESFMSFIASLLHAIFASLLRSELVLPTFLDATIRTEIHVKFSILREMPHAQYYMK